MNELFNHVHHICLVVADVDNAVAFYESIGIGGWHNYPQLSQYDNDELNVPDRRAFLELRYVYTDAVDGLQIQLVEPGPGDTPQRRFLERTGGGVFHVGFAVDDVDTATRTAGGAGIPVLMSGRRDDRTGFTYLDTAKRAGVVLELRR
ncbi:VOC family protein [Nocardia salmonicida]|uniref:VOC family protein n=1 Tax=Nocardia salmonicida TaxID=53431 RepID=UPI0007A465C6|nr:VOC family protein [Nocardia salmonicida]